MAGSTRRKLGSISVALFHSVPPRKRSPSPRLPEGEGGTRRCTYEFEGGFEGASRLLRVLPVILSTFSTPFIALIHPCMSQALRTFPPFIQAAWALARGTFPEKLIPKREYVPSGVV